MFRGGGGASGEKGRSRMLAVGLPGVPQRSSLRPEQLSRFDGAAVLTFAFTIASPVSPFSMCSEQIF